MYRWNGLLVAHVERLLLTIISHDRDCDIGGVSEGHGWCGSEVHVFASCALPRLRGAHRGIAAPHAVECADPCLVDRHGFVP